MESLHHNDRGRSMACQQSVQRNLEGWVHGQLTTLRPLMRDDIPQVEAWDNDPEIAALMGSQPLRETPQEWYHRTLTDRSCRALAIETKDGRLIGTVMLAEINWRSKTAEVRICIGYKECWGAGYGSDALRTVLGLAYEAWGLSSVYLRVFLTNERAIRCYARCGFRRVGVLAASHRRADPSKVLLMALSRERWVRLHRSA